MRRSRLLLSPAVCIALALTLSAVGFAQSDTAQVSGFVKDPTGAVVPASNVVVKNEATGLERRAVTNETGYYVIASLPPGFYTITVEATGFKRYVKTQNKLDPNLAATIDATLAVGVLSESIEVVAAAAAVQSETATVGKLIEGSQIQNMMLNGRNPVYLALLKPGVRGGSMQAFDYGLTLGGLSINGSRSQDNLITYDGAVGIRTRGNNTSVGVADLETVQEIQILTYNAEYGRASGGQVRIVTRGGARDFHGSIYEYFRNEKLDANTWSRNRAGEARPANRFNQFGYIVSGPVYLPGRWNTSRSKLFFLWGQEWVRHRQEQTSIQTVPSAAMRRGDFSELLNAANPFFRRVRAVADPASGAPFPSNVIPPSQLSPNGLGFLRAYPEPVPGYLQGTNNFIQTRPQPVNQRKDTLSIDFNPTDKHTFRFRHQNYAFTQLDAFRTGFDLAASDWDRPNKIASLNHIWTTSPTLINELLVTASVDRVRIGMQKEGARYSRSKYGINYPYLFPERKEIFDKIPTIAIANFGMLDGSPYPSSSAGLIYVISDSLTKIRGNHTLKFGASFEYSGQNDFDQINVAGVPGGSNNQNGRFAFSDTRTGAPTSGLAIASAALGLFDTYAEIGQRGYTPYRGKMFELFAQDSWKATSRLRLEFGVRYTIMTPFWYSLWRNMAVFDPRRYDPAKAVVQAAGTGYILSGDRYNGVVFPGTGWPKAARGRVAIADTGEFDRLFSGGSQAWGELQTLNFQPRIGLAYAFSPKTVVRSGFGRFMARPGMSGNMLLGGNPPLQPMASIANAQADNPGGGRATNFPFFFMTTEPVFKIATAYNWNLTFERQVPLGTTVSVAYVGRVGLFMERERDINQLPVGTLTNPASRGINVNVLRPYKGFASIAMREMAARSAYHGLQIEVNRRFARGLSYGLGYTYSKARDGGSDFRAAVYDAYNARSFWGPADTDTRHVASIGFIYALPLFRNRSTLAGKLLGGWQVTGATQFQTGTPVTVGTGDDYAGIGSSALQPWEMTGDPKLPRGERRFSESGADQNFYFRTTTPDGKPIFTAPAAGTCSKTQNRNSALYNVGFQNWNAALFKDFVIHETQRVQLRGEFFNWPNYANWGAATVNPRSGTFGKVSAKGGGRDVQLSLRYSF
jgi:hypothetical protein